MIWAICFSCEASPLFAGKTVCSGVIDCTASESVLAYAYAFVVMESSACTSEMPVSRVSSACAVNWRALHSEPSEQLASPKLPGDTETGEVELPLQNKVSPATEVIMGIEAPEL